MPESDVIERARRDAQQGKCPQRKQVKSLAKIFIRRQPGAAPLSLRVCLRRIYEESAEPRTSCPDPLDSSRR